MTRGGSLISTLITFAPKDLAQFTALNWYLKEPFEEAFIFHGANELAPLRQWIAEFGEKIAPRKVVVVEISEQESLAKLFEDKGEGTKSPVENSLEKEVTMYLKQVVPDINLDPRAELAFYNFQLLFSGEWVSDKLIVDVTHCPRLLIGNFVYYAIRHYQIKFHVEIVAWDDHLNKEINYPTTFPDSFGQDFLDLIGQGADAWDILQDHFRQLRHGGHFPLDWVKMIVKRDLIAFGLVNEETQHDSKKLKLTSLGKGVYHPLNAPREFTYD